MRNPADQEQKKSERIGLRLTQAERKLIEEQSSSGNLTMSEFVRQCISSENQDCNNESS